MNITAAPNNGTAGALDHILKSPRKRNNLSDSIEYRRADNVFHDADEYLSYVKSVDCGFNCMQLTDEQVPFVIQYYFGVQYKFKIDSCFVFC